MGRARGSGRDVLVTIPAGLARLTRLVLGRICSHRVGTPNRFAFSASGYVLVLFDGKELLVYGDGDPRWRKELEAEPIGLAATADVVVTLEAGGRISWWRAR